MNTRGQVSVLYSFPGGASGANPYASLNLDLQGNIYGTTYAGGSQNFGTIFKTRYQGGRYNYGSVFELVP